MWLSLFCLLLFLAIAYFQMIQGMFSAMIMFVLTLLSLAIAFTSYEYVALNWLAGWQPDLAIPIAFMGTFVVPLMLMRLIFDTLIRRTVLIPIIADRVAAAVFGLFTGLIITGVLVLGIQMVPFGGSFLGYARVDQVQDLKFTDEQDPREIQDQIGAQNNKLVKLADPAREEDIWLSPDRVAVRFARLLSNGIFSGERDFEHTHPDLVQEVGWSQATERDTLHFAKPGSVTVQEARHVDYVYDRIDTLSPDAKPTYEPVQPKNGNFVAVRLSVSPDGADRDNRKRLQLRQIVLVGSDATRGQLRQYYPIAITDVHQNDKHVRVISTPSRYGATPVKKPAADMVFQIDDGKDSIEVVFDLPEKFKAEYLIYKLGARAPFPRGKEGSAGTSSAAPAPRSSSELAGEPSGASHESSGGSGSGGTRARPGGRVGGARAIAVGTHYGEDFPVPMTSYQGFDEEVASDQLQQGHLVGHVADQGEKTDSKMVSRFKVPGNKRLLQFNVENLRARSGLGRALSLTVKTLQNFQLHDATGHVYTPVGRFALANVDGDEIVEIVYFPEYAESGARAGTSPFKRILDRHMQGDSYKLVYLFLIDPGAEIVRFQTGSAASPAEDLKGVVPKAPD